MNYVQDLIQHLESAWETGNYNTISFDLTNGISYNCTIDELTGLNRYFFKITYKDSIVMININQLNGVELYCGKI